jgi:peptidoglycan/xylan/chitin deacetylase (PgdA/CDA1 family)
MSSPPSSPAPPRNQPPPGPPPRGPARAGAIRRRRAGAGVVLGGLFVLALAASLAGGGSSSSVGNRGGSGPTAGRRRHDPAARHATIPAPTPAEGHAQGAGAEAAAVSRVLAYTPAVTEGGDRGHELALTFDDGPGPYTLELVRTLNRLHVKATFFAIGEEERYFSAGTVAELRAGDVVGDHTETHPMMAAMSAREQYEELWEQIVRIQVLGGPTPRLFRPPYGSFDATTFKQLKRLHLLMVLWSDDTSDYTLPGVAAIVQRALAGAHAGAIILMHDAGGDRSETIAALPAIVAGLRRKGLQPVTIPRLLLDDPPPRGQPLPRSLAGD